MKAIVAADLDWGIGYQGKLLERIPDDLRLFKKLTTGNIVVMGRKTYESLPSFARPLHGRTNIVMTRNNNFYVPKGVITLNGEQSLMYELEYNQPKDKEVFIIGGAEIYRKFLFLCDIIYVTKIQKRYTADSYFKNIDIGREFRLLTASDALTHNGVGYNFLKYERMVEKKKIP